MDPDIVYSRCIAVVGYIAMATYLYLLVRVWRQRLAKQLCKRRREGPKTASACGLRTWYCPRRLYILSPDIPRIEVEAFNLALKQRLMYWKLMLKLFMHFAAGSLVFFSYFRHIQGNIWSRDAVGQDPSSDPLTLCLLLLSAGILVEFRPVMLKARFTDCFNAAYIGLLIWKAAASEDAFLLTFRSRGIAPMRFALGVWSGNTPLTCTLNVLYAFVCVWSYTSLVQGRPDVGEKFGTGHELWFAFDEALMAFVVSAATYAIETRGLAESRATVKAHIAKQSEATVNSLLTCLCDAVVRLSPDFEILSGSAGLLSLLLKQAGSVRHFLDAVEQSDRQRFLDYAFSTHNIHSMDVRGPAPSLHVCMPDANGTSVDAQLFMASFPDLDNRYEYLLGIREISKEENDLSRWGVDASTSSLLDHHALVARKKTHSDESSVTETDNSSESLPWQAHIDSLRSSDEVPEFYVVLNLFTFSIFEASPAFIGLGGPSTIGGDFNMWLLEPEAFKRLVQSAASQFMIDGENVRASLGKVWLQPPIARQAKIEYRADCDVELLWGLAEDLDDEDMFFRLELNSLSQRRSKAKKKKGATICRNVQIAKGATQISL